MIRVLIGVYAHEFEIGGVADGEEARVEMKKVMDPLDVPREGEAKRCGVLCLGHAKRRIRVPEYDLCLRPQSAEQGYLGGSRLRRTRKKRGVDRAT